MKTKWLLITGRAGLKDIAASVQNYSFRTDRGAGFELIERNSRRISVRFVERLVTIEEVLDPFGLNSRIENTRYIRTKVQIHSINGEETKFLLEVFQPPRSIRSLVDSLAVCIPYLSVREFELPLIGVFRAIKKTSLSCRITRIKASRLMLDANSEARVEILSTKDALACFSSSFPKAVSTFDKIRIERPFNMASTCLDVTRNGLVNADDAAEDLVRKFLLAYLPTAG